MRAVLILAGGAATRLPGKLERELHGEPMILRVFRNMQDAGDVYIAANRTLPPSIDRRLTCPIIVDRHPGAGPLAAVFDALGFIRANRVFVAGGDMPFVTAPLAQTLEAAWHAGTGACVAVDGGGNLQPLCALYDRAALLEAAGAALSAGSRSMKSALDRMRVTRVPMQDDRVLAGVNTPEDLVAVRTFDLGFHSRA